MIKNLKKVQQILVYLCGILLFACVLMISAEVFLRKFFLFSFGGVDEVSGYILGICVAWSLPYVLFEKMHIRIDILYNKSKKIFKSFMDLLSFLLTLVFSAFLSFYASLVALISFEKGSTANTPLGTSLWIPQSIWALGLTFFLFCVFVLFLKAIKAFIENRIDEDVSVKRGY